jgi:hypothetical protein
MLIKPSEQKKPLDQVLHPFAFFEHHLSKFTRRGRLRVALGKISELPQSRNGLPQLM